MSLLSKSNGKRAVAAAVFLSLLAAFTAGSFTVNAANMEWVIGEDGKSYWYENDVKQGTYEDPQGVEGDGTVRGREIYDPGSDGWYWLDSVYNGAKAVSKEVWMPYIYQHEADWDEEEINNNAAASGADAAENIEHAEMASQVKRAIEERTGKWVRYTAEGKMVKGWYEVSGDELLVYPEQAGNIYYYDRKTGLMAKGWTRINGVDYHFDETTGVLDTEDNQIPEYNAPVNADNVIKLVRTYDPEGYYILQDGFSHGESIDGYASHGSNATSADTCVHEMFHTYTWNNFQWEWDSDLQECYYVGDGRNIMVPVPDTFKTEEWSTTLPENLRSIRYNTYVSEGSEVGANQDGAYGLLNELCAYYWGLHDQIQLYDYFMANGANVDFENAVQNGIQAYAEFRFWTLGYLNYAKTAHPEVYEAFLSNTSYVNTYCLMERKYEHLINDAQQKFNVSYGDGYGTHALGSAWRSDAEALYEESKKQPYAEVEAALFARTTEAVLPALILH